MHLCRERGSCGLLYHDKRPHGTAQKATSLGRTRHSKGTTQARRRKLPRNILSSAVQSPAVRDTLRTLLQPSHALARNMNKKPVRGAPGSALEGDESGGHGGLLGGLLLLVDQAPQLFQALHGELRMKLNVLFKICKAWSLQCCYPFKPTGSTLCQHEGALPLHRSPHGSVDHAPRVP